MNLASKDKMVKPRYQVRITDSRNKRRHHLPNVMQELSSKDIPRATIDGVTAVVIAGEALGVTVSESIPCNQHFIILLSLTEPSSDTDANILPSLHDRARECARAEDS